MVLLSVKCPCCGSAKVVKFSKQPNEAQQYTCHNEKCFRSVFQFDYKYHACKPSVEFCILEISINSSEVRDISRVLHISKMLL